MFIFPHRCGRGAMSIIRFRRVLQFYLPTALLLAVPQQALGQWSTIDFVDAFGESTGLGAISAETGAVQTMSFPYQNVTARFVVDCDHTWIRFDTSPNLTRGDFIGFILERLAAPSCFAAL